MVVQQAAVAVVVHRWHRLWPPCLPEAARYREHRRKLHVYLLKQSRDRVTAEPPAVDHAHQLMPEFSEAVPPFGQL